MTGIPSRQQRRRREAGLEGSSRQSSGPRNTKRIRGERQVGEEAFSSEAQRSSGPGERICDGWMERRSRVLPREICVLPESMQKSAEAVVAAGASGGEGPNT